MIVRDAELPVRVKLVYDRSNRRAQPAFIGVIDRHDHRQQRLIREPCGGVSYGANVTAPQSLIARDPPPLVLETIAGSAEPLSQPGIEWISRTLERKVVNAGVDGAKKSTWPGLAQQQPGV